MSGLHNADYPKYKLNWYLENNIFIIFYQLTFVCKKEDMSRLDGGNFEY